MLGATPPCVRRRLRRIATTALTAAVVLGLYASGFAGIAKAGLFSDATSRLFGRSSSRMDLAPIVAELPSGAVSALLCVERDPEACHRSLIAERMADELGVAVKHLRP